MYFLPHFVLSIYLVYSQLWHCRVPLFHAVIQTISFSSLQTYIPFECIDLLFHRLLWYSIISVRSNYTNLHGNRIGSLLDYCRKTQSKYYRKEAVRIFANWYYARILNVFFFLFFYTKNSICCCW